MSLCINEFKNIEKYFGEIIEKMNDNPISTYLEKEIDRPLKNFDKMLECLKKCNIDFLIDEYKKKGIKDNNRIYSLISEIRAGAYLSHKSFPVEYIKEGDDKTPDIKTKIAGRDTFVEVKRMTERRFKYNELQEEFKNKKIQYDVEYHLLSVIHSASDIIEEIKKNIPKKVTEFYEIVPFKYGKIRVKTMEHSKPIFRLTTSYSVRQTKEQKEQSNDSYISMDEIENSIISDLDNSLKKFDEYCDKSDLCFLFLDDIDVQNYGHPELRKFLYGGVSESIVINDKIIDVEYNPIPEVTEAKKIGWNKILNDLDFINGKIDYSDKKGWYFYHKGSEYLNGVFHCFAYDFSFRPIYCFLNPFVIRERNIPELENILEYYHEQDIQKFDK